MAGTGAGALLAACSVSGGAAEKPATTAPAAGAATGAAAVDLSSLKGAKVGIVGINLKGPTVARAVSVMEGLAKQHEFKVDAVDTAFDLLKTNDTMRVWTDQGYDAIVVANTEAANIADGLQAAGTKKIPVAGFYCGVAPGLAFDVGANEWIAGNKVATYISQRLLVEGKGRGIAIFGYTPLANLRTRELAVTTQAGFYKIPIVSRQEVNADNSAVDVQNKTGDILTRFPKGGHLGAVFVPWDEGGYAAVSALEAAGRDDIFVVSLDGEQPNLDSIRKGGPQGATVVNDMVAVSNVVLDQIGKILGGAKPPKNPQLFVDSPLVTSDNVPKPGVIPEGTGLTPYYTG
ncbi:sugar ABC transporter substrate-binding protein [Nocardioides sp. AN3]